MISVSKSHKEEVSTLARRRGSDDVEKKRSWVFSRRIVQIDATNVGEEGRIVKDLYKKSKTLTKNTFQSCFKLITKLLFLIFENESK
jgi:hypothetical protein